MPSSIYPYLTQPGQLGPLYLPHRMLMGAMHLGIEGDHQMLSQLIAFYRERVQGGAALITTGGVAVHPTGVEGQMFCLTSRGHQHDLEQLALATHQAGGKIALQLFHGGRYSRSEEIGQATWAPSAIASKLTREVPTAMHPSQIQEIIESYGRAAHFASEAGFDAVEIMGAEGYLLNQFVSPMVNHRTDAYGGWEGGMAFIDDMTAAVRRNLPADRALIFRISGWDLMPEEYDLAHVFALAQRLVAIGVNALNIGIGWHESSVPTVAQHVPPGAFVQIATAIRQHVSVPVIASNRIAHHDQANFLIQHARVDFVAPARSWLADPDWAAKGMNNRPGVINPCIACNQACLDRIFNRPPRPVGCMVNPRTGRERELPMAQGHRQKTVAVVGSGPGGMAAARAAALRGHHVVLFEAADDIGGQLRWAARIPWKHVFWGTIGYYRHELLRLNVAIRCAIEPTIEELITFDHVILATGVRPRIPSIPAINGYTPLTYAQVLEMPELLPGRPVIIGGGGIGIDLALYFAIHQGSFMGVEAFFRGFGLPSSTNTMPPVTLVTRQARLGTALGRTTGWIIRDALNKWRVAIETEVQILHVALDGVTITRHGDPEWIPGDFTILCTGQEANRDLEGALQGKVSVQTVGGARETRGLDAVRAFREGFEAGNAL
ncbi:MAG: FAD-dependent oxidoreductase [Firmicutes bacterium]|jgi:2,4-dienoyl-CoA reductase (NADPH2)|nr:FAD-dependent oxidoreductase [Bacillota bacterium]